jgi:hypothetical protein
MSKQEMERKQILNGKWRKGGVSLRSAPEMNGLE